MPPRHWAAAFHGVGLWCAPRADRATLGQRLTERLRTTLPHVDVEQAELDQAYYDGVRISFGADNTAGEHVPIGDAGAFDWVATLTANHRQHFVAAGFGLQLLPVLFR